MFITQPTPALLLETAQQIASNPSELTLLMVAEGSQLDIEEVIDLFKQQGKTLMGGIFPKVISEGTQQNEGVLVKSFPTHGSPILVRDLANSREQLTAYQVATAAPTTAITFVDGLTSDISNFLFDLHQTFGNAINYLGGGAGSLSLQQQPCVFTTEGIFQDAAVVALGNLQSKLAVKHGWKEVMGPLVATETDRNVIKKLNWQEAFPVYQQMVSEGDERQISADNFFDISKEFPFGMMREGSEMIVRDPIATNEQGEIICVGEVQENSVLHLLQGEPDLLIAAAEEAAQEAVKQLPDFTRCLVVSCISRVLFMGNRFEEEIEKIDKVITEVNPELPAKGILTLGEISTSGSGQLELFNKTVVVGLMK